MSENEHGFFRHGDNAYLANFSEAEREVLTNLVEQIIELLAERVDHHNDDPLAAIKQYLDQGLYTGRSLDGWLQTSTIAEARNVVFATI